MALTLNGSANTIAGLAVGGLPDGIVDTDMIAASAVTAAKSAGRKVINIQTMSTSSSHSHNSTSFTNTNLVDSITPSASANYVFGTAQCMILFTSPNNGEAQWRVTRQISGGSQTALDSEVWSGIGHPGGSSSDNSYVPMTFTWCDHPNTTSAVEYRLQSLTSSSSSTVYTYRLQYMTLWEVAIG